MGPVAPVKPRGPVAPVAPRTLHLSRVSLDWHLALESITRIAPVDLLRQPEMTPSGPGMLANAAVGVRMVAEVTAAIIAARFIVLKAGPLSVSSTRVNAGRSGFVVRMATRRSAQVVVVSRTTAAGSRSGMACTP
jgi:hypothetical protein